MYRFFDAVICPLLDAAKPSVIVEIGSDNGHNTELLANWCAKRGAVLHSVDPLPKYDVDEWASRWPGVITFHKDLSLNALVEIGPADAVCIDGDHNWYTVIHELEILGRNARTGGRPFPLTLLHDVGWPYGRRDLYYDPDTIPVAFRHPHRKAGLSPDSRALLDHGFNDHLENAIHEGTPRNGVLTAVEDFIEQYDGDLLLRTVPGIHGLGIILDAAMAKALGTAWAEVIEAPGLLRMLEAVEDDRLQRLGHVSKLERDLLRERDRVERVRAELAERVERQRELDAEIERLGAAADQSQRDLLEEREQLGRARTELAERVERQRELDAEIERVGAAADQLRDELQGARAAAEQLSEELEHARAAAEAAEEETARLRAQEEGTAKARQDDRRTIEKRDQELASLRTQVGDLQRSYTRLRGRRGVRLALKVSGLARPLFRLRRGQLTRPGSRQSGQGGPQGKQIAPPAKEPEPPAVAPAPPTTEYRFRETDTGRFYSIMRRLLDHGVKNEFINAWAASEDDVGTQAGLSPAGEQPLVSIVMPTYNRASLIVDAIDSVLEQSYSNWELLVCDDASEDDTEAVVRQFDDDRISYERLPKAGAASARNAGLARSRGELVAYLDSDNLWHPRFLETLVSALVANPGRYAAYCKYVDTTVAPDTVRLKKFGELPFNYDQLSEKNFIDLNSLVHRKLLYEHFGGFKEELVRQQDWDLILKYSFLRDPLYIDRFLMLYRRSDDWNQITNLFRGDVSSPAIIRSSVAGYHRDGLPSTRQTDLPTLSVISWDICRNHFSKAYNIAEAMEALGRVQLVGFRFFDEPIFPPYAKAQPSFETCYLQGGRFPEWETQLARAVANTRGDVVYAVKPRLPSLGVALLANYHFGKPIVLEMNDLESVVTDPKAGQEASGVRLEDVDPADPQLLDPDGQLWTAMMEGLASEVPLRVTHNSVLDEHFGGGAFFLRNPKDEQHFDPDRHDREAVRARLGFQPHERVLLFGGMVRRHKGVFEFLELLERAGPQYRLLIVGSRETPDQATLRRKAGDRVKIIEPVDRNEMAAINLASDAVILWLAPNVPASRYQMPFKLTDALAMKVPVLANDIGDLGELGRQGYLRLVPFGQVDALVASLDRLFADHDARLAMVEAGRDLYLRQFSYSAVRSNLGLILSTAAATTGTLSVAEEFAEFLSAFYAHLPALVAAR